MAFSGVGYMFEESIWHVTDLNALYITVVSHNYNVRAGMVN